MLLTETHLHTKEISMCAVVFAKEIPALYKEAGYGVIIVTDHYNKWTLEVLSLDRNEQISKWLEGYRTVKSVGEEIGLKVFLGMELALVGAPEDYLIYGIDEDFLYQYPSLVDLNLQEVYEIAEKEGLLIYQAHPFREYLKPAPLQFIKGVEVYNGNPRHNSHNDKAVDYAEKNSLLKLSGSDFHQIEDLGQGGIYLPENINDNKQLISYLKNNKVELFVGE